MSTLSSGMDFVDLNFLGRPGIIATAILQSTAGVALIDPGPSTTLAGLKSQLAGKGIGLPDIRQILLTHIHLDHARPGWWPAPPVSMARTWNASGAR